ncbi:3'-5' exonuclease [Rhodococcus opacus]|nr:3'-5' exonuclease [Rhodococcus opacus]
MRQTTDVDRHWREVEYLVIDIETTGLDPRRDALVSYGAVPIREGRIKTTEGAYSLVNPRRDVPAKSVRVHGLRAQDLFDAPSAEECFARLLPLMEGRILVAHAAWIERGFLRRIFKSSKTPFHYPVVDTAELARHVLSLEPRPGAAVSLEYAATSLRLPVHTPHHALGDAMTTAELFLLLTNRLDAHGDLSARKLLQMSADA